MDGRRHPLNQIMVAATANVTPWGERARVAVAFRHQTTGEVSGVAAARRRTPWYNEKHPRPGLSLASPAIPWPDGNMPWKHGPRLKGVTE